MSTNSALPIGNNNEAPDPVSAADESVPYSEHLGEADVKSSIEDSSTNGLPPIPPAIKYGLPLLLLLIVSGGLVVYYFLASDDGADLPADGAAIVDPAYSLGGGAVVSTDSSPDIDSITDESVVVGDTSGIAPLPALRTRVADALRTRVAELELSLDRLHSSVGTIDSSLSTVRSHLPALQSDVEQVSDINSRFDKRLSSIEDLLSSLQSSASDIRKDLSQLKGRVWKNAQALKAKVSRAATRPPFRLVSVDEWGSEYSAVLEMSGSSTVAAVGDSRAGWVVQRIDKSGCIFVTNTKKPASKAVRVCKEAL